MSKRILAASAAALLLCAGPALAAPLLDGSVSAPKGGALEGVLIKATDAKTGNAVSVFSQADGRFGFPDGTLKPGHYKIEIRATGYDLAAPVEVDLAEGKTQGVPLALKTVDPTAAEQWTNAELINALPPSAKGAPFDQRFVLNMCTHCHSVELVLNGTEDKSAMLETIARMGNYAVSSVPARPVLRPDAAEHMAQNKDKATVGHDELALLFKGSVLEDMASYFVKVNKSGNHKPAKPTAFPRPTGEATKVVIRSWALPRKEAMPHDVIIDAKGIAWYTDFGTQVLGRLDPATGKIEEFKLPILRADAPESSLDIHAAADGSIWVAMMYQAAVARFDPKTKKFKTWSIPKENSPGVAQTPMLEVEHSGVDGKIWIGDASIAGVHRVDLKTGKVETFKPVSTLGPSKGTGFPHTAYGIAADPQNNLYFADWGESQIGRIDAKTGAVTFYQTLSAPSRPRRGHMDAQNRFWFAEWQADAVGMLDPKTGKVQEWKLPLKGAAPYDAVLDDFGNVWAAGMATDRVSRVNVATGKVTDYLLPERNVNTRRVFVQNTKTGPVFWVGNNLGATIHAVQPLE